MTRAQYRRIRARARREARAASDWPHPGASWLLAELLMSAILLVLLARGLLWALS